MRWTLALLPIALLACTKSKDAGPTPKAAPPSSASKAPATAADPSGPPKIGLPMTCQLGPCHGLDDLTCKAGPPMMCTEIYKHGDFCRQFVKCAQTARGCVLEADPKFEQCKACMERCKTTMTCEDTCRTEMGVE